MIDQLVSGLPQAPQPVNNNARERKQSSGEQDDASGSFEEIVSKAGQKQPQKGKSNAGDVDLTTPDAGKRQPSTDASSRISLDLSAALRGLANTSQAQVKVANVKEVLKAATDRSEMTGQRAEAVMTKLVDKLKQAAQQTEQVAEKLQQAAEAVHADGELPMSTADELEQLLGLVSPKETESRPQKKAADADKAAAKDDDGHALVADKPDAKIDTARVENVLIAPNTKSDNDKAPGADDAPTKGDVVRLVSANGRGRPVDVEVPAVTGEVQKDAPKSSNTPKFETATVLEARRYLGFTPEPNATALATAIKADPTWTEALRSAQRSDLGTLGNTVTEVNTLKLQLNPENLGNMVATLKLKGEELTVELRVDTIEAYRYLSADHDDIVKGLQDQGFSIDKVTVQLNATEKTDAGADRDMGRQNQAQRDELAQQRDGQRGRDGSRPDGQPRWTPTGDVHESASGDGRTEPDRTGNLYL